MAAPLGIALVIVSGLLYFEQIELFHAPRDTFFYLFQDMAFVPINVLIVTLIVDRVLRMREKAALLKKLNMVIGAFFSEVGTTLLTYCIGFDQDSGTASGTFVVTNGWTDQQFLAVAKEARTAPVRMDCAAGDLDDLRTFLTARRQFLLGLLENQNLLEHETFTELLWAVFHLMEELASRDSLQDLPKGDCDHLAGDIRRVYLMLGGGVAILHEASQDRLSLSVLSRHTDESFRSAGICDDTVGRERSSSERRAYPWKIERTMKCWNGGCSGWKSVWT